MESSKADQSHDEYACIYQHDFRARQFFSHSIYEDTNLTEPESHTNKCTLR
jgi:hypothetical protein